MTNENMLVIHLENGDLTHDGLLVYCKL